MTRQQHHDIAGTNVAFECGRRLGSAAEVMEVYIMELSHQSRGREVNWITGGARMEARTVPVLCDHKLGPLKSSPEYPSQASAASVWPTNSIAKTPRTNVGVNRQSRRQPPHFTAGVQWQQAERILRHMIHADRYSAVSGLR